jgi:CDP-diacylglycerol--glycerol-3-phosphate 3-phosphatidyltransferase
MDGGSDHWEGAGNYGTALDNLGKQKMVFQTVAILGLLLHYEYYGVNFHAIGMFFLWMAVIITLWSGFNYFRNFWHVLEEDDTDQSHSD